MTVKSPRRSLHRTMLLVGALAFLAALAGLPGRATPGAQVTADEPQYLLTAQALFERRDLDIGPGLRSEAWRAYHRDRLPVQTRALPGGRRLSPHDPLLPVLLAVPVGLGGWVGAKAALAALAGLLAALLVWISAVRFAVPRRIAALVVGAFAIVPPFVAYGTQLYPELPGALLVAVAVAALTGPTSRRSTATWVLALVALPWLSVKYAPVVVALAALGGLGLVRDGRRRQLVGAAVVLAAAGVVYLAVHRAVYGGWTVYAAGNHFADGEATVMGRSPDYLARATRLVALLVDRDFGLAAWAPALLAMVPAFAALARRRPPGWSVLALPMLVGWCNATFVALTMHGWWWPGRQVVVVLPLAVLAIAWWCGTVVAWDRARPLLVAATAFGVLAWAWLQVEVALHRRSVILDFDTTANPASRAWRLLLPDARTWSGLDQGHLALWALVLVVAAIWGWQTAAMATPADGDVVEAGASGGGDEDAGAGEGADADVAPVDLHGGGAVR